MSRTIELRWTGPFRVGNLHEVPEYEARNPGPYVYMYLLNYVPPAKPVIYAGQTKECKERWNEHLRNFLGLQYWLRDENGDRKYEHKSIGDFDRLNELVPLATAELNRLEWYVAPCPAELLSDVEASVIRLLKSKPEELVCDNTNQPAGGHDLELVHSPAVPDSAESVKRFLRPSAAR